MTNRILILLPILLMGCSTDEAKRVSFDTLQNIGEAQCRKNPTADCPKSRSYDEYQKQLKENGTR